MTKVLRDKPASAKSRLGTAGKVLGTTKDGVRILRPKGKATHFTQKEVREAVARALATEPAE